MEFAPVRGALLADALERAARSGIAAFALLVDAMDETAAAFYRHHGFTAPPDSLLTPVMTHGNSAPIFETAKHNLDFVPLLIKFFIVFQGRLYVLYWRNTSGNAFFKQDFAIPYGIITSIGQ